MKVEYSKQSLKDLAVIPSKLRTPIEKFIFNELPETTSISESKKIELLKGYKNFFKVRLGNYRVGIYKEGNTLIVKRILHCKEIYRYFP